MNKLSLTNSAFLKNIKAFAFDVDGVMTDGSLFYSKNGEEIKVFNVKDGLGIKMLLKKAQVIVISGNPSLITQKRCMDLGIKHSHIGVQDKRELMLKLLLELGIKKEESLYIGDDLNDLPLRSVVGHFLAPIDADLQVKQISDFIIPVNGGRGVLRFLVNCYLYHNSDKQFDLDMW
jgi:3-deoxy-D-manno-octulosonate 8-phosphate phosphatase (KDO 8-P phosphatase)